MLRDNPLCDIHVIVPNILNDDGVNKDAEKWRKLGIEPAEIYGSTYTERNLHLGERVAEAATSGPTVLLTLGGGPGTHTETFGTLKEVAKMGSLNGYLAVINDGGGISQLGTFGGPNVMPKKADGTYDSVPLEEAIDGMTELATMGSTTRLSNLQNVLRVLKNKQQASEVGADSAGGG